MGIIQNGLMKLYIYRLFIEYNREVKRFLERLDNGACSLDIKLALVACLEAYPAPFVAEDLDDNLFTRFYVTYLISPIHI